MERETSGNEYLLNAVNYIEEHLTEKINYNELGKVSYSSGFHFQRVFGIVFGLTVGDYIRRRRMSLAGAELFCGKAKVLDVAVKYGYETAESFSRAFLRFHGVLPSKVKGGVKPRFYPKISLDKNTNGDNKMLYKMENKSELILTGYKKRFSGVPFGEERTKQEEEFFVTTRAKQWLLIGASQDKEKDYCVVTNIDDSGYDFYIAYELDEWTRSALFDSEVTGVDFMDKMGFETLVIPNCDYAVFETEKKKRPVADYIDIRRKIGEEFCLDNKYIFTDSPELTIMHWRPSGEWEKNRYIEICLPIEVKRSGI